MNNSLRSKFLLPIFLLPMLQPPALSSDKTVMQGLTLQQQSPEHGDVTVVVTKQAMRIDAPRAGISIVTRAPDWQVTTFARDRKTQFVTSFSEFDKNGFSNLRSVPRKGKDLHLSQRKSSPTVMFAIPCNRYQLLQVKPNGMAPRVLDQMLYSDKKAVTDTSSHGLEIVDTVEKYPSQIAAVLTRLYDIPVTQGLPIAEIEEYRDGRVRFNLKTKSIVKSTVPASVFDKPAGFKQLRAFSDVTSSDKSQKNAEDIFKSLGVGEDFGNVKKSKPAP